jgi:carboxymethylenebutenolidase
MGGNASVTAAGAFPDRFAGIASFHGGNLGTDKPDSPHLFVKNITGRVYVAGAIEDASFPEEQKIRLEKALTDAGVNHVVETYSGARTALRFRICRSLIKARRSATGQLCSNSFRRL